MDKTQRKKLLKDIKEQEHLIFLQELTKSENLLVAAMAKIELGIPLPDIQSSEILAAADTTPLFDRLKTKIIEQAFHLHPCRLVIDGISDESIALLSPVLQMFWFSQEFEMMLGQFDAEKYFYCDAEQERQQLQHHLFVIKNYYSKINAPEMVALIDACSKIKSKVNAEEQFFPISERFTENRIKIEMKALSYLKKNWTDFVFDSGKQ